jgi:hypothetical protein
VGSSVWFRKGTGFAAVGPAGLIWILSGLYEDALAASVAVSSKYQVPAPVGVPLIAPVLVSSASPSGNDPPTSHPVPINPL